MTISVPVKATQTSVRVLEKLIELDGARVTAIANELELSKSSVHNHLETLETLNFVNKENHEYRVSLRFLQIGSYARGQLPLYTAGRSEVVRLGAASSLTAGLVAFEHGDAICLMNSVGSEFDDSDIDEGTAIPLHCTAPGKAILAAVSSEQRDTLLDTCDFDSNTDQTITTRSALLNEIETVQARGLAVDREEWQPERRGIAATIVGADDQVLGAIYVIGTAEDLSGKRFQQDIPGLVLSSANRVQKNLRTL